MNLEHRVPSHTTCCFISGKTLRPQHPKAMPVTTLADEGAAERGGESVPEVKVASIHQFGVVAHE